MHDLYHITTLTATGITFTAEITFNPAHPVFASHFPGHPIVPGVVLVEITAAVVSQVTGMELIVKEASVIKFLQVIDPLQNPMVKIDGSIVKEGNGRYKVDLNFSAGENLFTKLRGIRLEKITDG